LTATFAQNLEARLGGKDAADLPAGDGGMDAGSLVFAVVAGRLRDLYRRLFGPRR
jgi:hypothetical protein